MVREVAGTAKDKTVTPKFYLFGFCWGFFFLIGVAFLFLWFMNSDARLLVVKLLQGSLWMVSFLHAVCCSHLHAPS